MNVWAMEKAELPGRILVERGDLRADDFALVEPLVAKHVERHGDDPERSRASLSSVSWLRRCLAAIADPGLNASLMRLGAARRWDATRRRPPVSRWVTHRRPVSGSASCAPHARGGLGEVFGARDAELNREVALKQIQDRHADHPDSRSRFLLEGVSKYFGPPRRGSTPRVRPT